MKSLEPGYSINQWKYEGQTEIAYSTPGGSWETDGFIFTSIDHSFILRSIPEGTNDAIYIVVESNRTQSQLANLALHNPDKFVHKDGRVTILETFDMTVGFGRRSRKEVQEALGEVGFQNNVITSFSYTYNISFQSILLDILIWAVYRERAKALLQRTQEPEPVTEEQTERNYWLLKIYGDNWQLNTIHVNDKGHFNAFFNSFEKRPDYRNFQKTQVGDLGIAYDYSSSQSIVFFFTITQGLHIDERREEIISFTITAKPDKPVTLERLRQIIPFYEELDREHLAKLFPLLQEQYEVVTDIINLEGFTSHPETAPIITAPAKRFLAQVFADRAARDMQDHLDFESDVNALASVISYREVTPPIAIGLFGNWGTGKSFFIDKLQQRINELRADKSKAFCSNVLQIVFNSWHYSDSNLWASLITKIFEDLEAYGQSKPEELNSLFSKLHSTKELLQEKKDEKKKIDDHIHELTEKKKLLDNDVKNKSDRLESLDVQEIFNGLIRDKSLQNDIKDLTDKYSFLKLKEFNDIENNLETLDSFSTKVGKSIVYMFSLMKGKRLILALLFMGMLVAAYFFLINNTGLFKSWLPQYRALIITFSGLLSLYVAFLQPAIKVVNEAFRRIKDLHQTVKSLRKKARDKYREEQEKMKTRLSDAQAEAGEVEKQISLLHIEQESLQGHINDIISGRKLIRFIESRVTDERYTNNLGIISWIRKDFEQLDYLLRQQKEAQGRQAHSEAGSVFRLERIILYIDDLDRCQEPIVVKVLEAIHLLLAFPLFVVVVGVDPRWMHNALSVQYRDLLASSGEKSRAKGSKKKKSLATSYDYLEKIFQIPFSLKPMNDAGKQALIRSQLKSAKPNTVLNFTPAKTLSIDMPEVLENLPSPVSIEGDTSSGMSNTFIPAPLPSEADTGVLLETLQVTDEEINFMEEISFIIGDSPRTLKRYINIYRIVRTHAQFKGDVEESEPYFAAMFLLAVITGLPELSHNFIAGLNAADEDESLANFLTSFAAHDEQTAPALMRLSEKIAAGASTRLKTLGKIPIRVLKQNIYLVCRFSFRTFTI